MSRANSERWTLYLFFIYSRIISLESSCFLECTRLICNDHTFLRIFSSVQFSWSVCPTLYDPMDCSTPGFPVHHQLSEPAQTHVRWVGDAIQPSHPLPSLSPPAFNLFQHQILFKWVSSSHQVAWEYYYVTNSTLTFASSVNTTPSTTSPWASVFLPVRGFPDASAVKKAPANAGDVNSIPGLDPLEKEMATYYIILAWRIPWTEEPGGLQSMESKRVRHNWATKQRQGVLG